VADLVRRGEGEEVDFFSFAGWQSGSIFPGSSPIGLPSFVFERAEPNFCSAIFGRPVMPIAPEAGV
jgi:hypothetical protein